MKEWLITDTHFEHKALRSFCGRPHNCDRRIIDAWTHDVSPDDIIFHLGDVGDATAISSLPGRKCLILGNHDKQSWSWYMSHGWSMVCDALLLRRYGSRVLLSHKPTPDNNSYDLNIHGHFHNNPLERVKQFEPEIYASLTPKHRLIMIEHHYRPVLLRHVVQPKPTFVHHLEEIPPNEIEPGSIAIIPK